MAYVNGRKQLSIADKTIPPLGEGLRGNVAFGIPYGTCSSALQKAVRRGIGEEAVQWALGMFWKSKTAQTNLWNRLLVMTVEDVGPANVLALPTVLQLYNNREKNPESYLAMAAAYLAQSKKTRINDWACYYHLSKGEISDLEEHYKKYVKALQDKNVQLSLQYVTDLAFCQDEVPEKLRKKLKVGAKKYPQILIWTGLDKVIGESKYLDKIKEIAFLKNWNSKVERSGKTRLLYSHAIILWCLSDFKDLDKYADSAVDEKAGTKLVKERVEQIKRFEALYGVPDYAYDKHTVEGRAKKRGMKHFVEEASRLENESEKWKEWSDYFLGFFKKNMM